MVLLVKTILNLNILKKIKLYSCIVIAFIRPCFIHFMISLFVLKPNGNISINLAFVLIIYSITYKINYIQILGIAY